MMRLVFPRSDGGVQIAQVALADRRPGETEVEQLERYRVELIEKRKVEDVPPVPVEESEIPEDQTFRAALVLVDEADPEHVRHGSGPLGYDMRRCREVHMARIRRARDRELARLDIEQLKGQDVAEQKQRLRDLPQTFDLTAAKTPAELKNLWPDELRPEHLGNLAGQDQQHGGQQADGEAVLVQSPQQPGQQGQGQHD